LPEGSTPIGMPWPPLGPDEERAVPGILGDFRVAVRCVPE
jgi:hypothetical protein